MARHALPAHTRLMHHRHPKTTQPIGRTSAAFTVLEMLTTLGVLAILLVIGVPTLTEYGLRQRMNASINALHTDLTLARSEAIQLNTQVVACPGNRATGCLDSNDWSQGWIIFSDLNGDKQLQALENIHRAEPALEQLLVLSTPGRRLIRFYPNGSAPGSNGSISFCDRRGPENARRLVISTVGRIRREEAPALDPEDCPRPL